MQLALIILYCMLLALMALLVNTVSSLGPNLPTSSDVS